MADETKPDIKPVPKVAPPAPAQPRPIDETVPGGRILVGGKIENGVRVGGRYVNSEGDPVDHPAE